MSMNLVVQILGFGKDRIVLIQLNCSPRICHYAKNSASNIYKDSVAVENKMDASLEQ